MDFALISRIACTVLATAGYVVAVLWPGQVSTLTAFVAVRFALFCQMVWGPLRIAYQLVCVSAWQRPQGNYVTPLLVADFVMMCVTFATANSAAFVVHFLHKYGHRLPTPTTDLGWYAVSAGLAMGAGIFSAATTFGLIWARASRRHEN